MNLLGILLACVQVSIFKLFRICVVCVLAFGADLQTFAFDGSSTLSKDQKSQLTAGQQVTVIVPREASFYPEFTAMQLVDASPEEIAAVAMDYGIRKDFQEYVVNAKVTEGVGATSHLVNWELNIPLVGRAHAAYRYEVSRRAGVIELRAESVDPPIGLVKEVSRLRVEKFDGGPRSLLSFQTTIDATWWITLVQSKASFFATYQRLLTAIAGQVMKEKKEDKLLLAAQLQRFNALREPRSDSKLESQQSSPDRR